MDSDQLSNSTDAKQDEQIHQLRRKVAFAWVTAVIGPLLALGGVVFSGLQWKSAARQLEVARSQLRDARQGAEQARKDTAQALRVAESQAISLRSLADAGKISAAAANRQLRVMERQAELMQQQLSNSQTAAVDTVRAVDHQLRLAEDLAISMQKLANASRDVAETSKATIQTSRDTLSVLQESLRRDQPQVHLALFHHIGVGVKMADASPNGWLTLAYTNSHIAQIKGPLWPGHDKNGDPTDRSRTPNGIPECYVLGVTNKGNRPIRIIRLWIIAALLTDKEARLTQQYNFDLVLSQESRRMTFAFDISVIPPSFKLDRVEIEGDNGERFSISEADAEIVAGLSKRMQ
jgi:hypothetical protein